MAVQLAHEGLAEAHHLGVALALGVEVRAALAAAHGQRGQGILEDLLEGQELQDAEVDRRVEAQAALVRADGAVHLDAEAAIDLHLALIVDPGNTEGHCPLRLAHTLENARLQVMRVGLEERPEAAQDLFDRLVEFRLVRVAFFQASKEVFDRFDHARSLGKLLSLKEILPGLYQFESHCDSAECRIYEIKWCICISIYA
ncbi:hypothetical protein D3C85_1137700 [compost metagenome]